MPLFLFLLLLPLLLVHHRLLSLLLNTFPVLFPTLFVLFSPLSAPSAAEEKVHQCCCLLLLFIQQQLLTSSLPVKKKKKGGRDGWLLLSAAADVAASAPLPRTGSVVPGVPAPPATSTSSVAAASPRRAAPSPLLPLSFASLSAAAASAVAPTAARAAFSPAGDTSHNRSSAAAAAVAEGGIAAAEATRFSLASAPASRRREALGGEGARREGETGGGEGAEGRSRGEEGKGEKLLFKAGAAVAGMAVTVQTAEPATKPSGGHVEVARVLEKGAKRQAAAAASATAARMTTAAAAAAAATAAAGREEGASAGETPAAAASSLFLSGSHPAAAETSSYHATDGCDCIEAVALLSGGKDSIYCMHSAAGLGPFRFVAAATLRPPARTVESDSFMFQSACSQLLPQVAAALGLPLFVREVQGAPLATERLLYEQTQGDEVEDLFLLLREVKTSFPRLRAVASGAIFSEYQRLRVENVCERLDLLPLNFLWLRPQPQLLQEMIGWRMHALLVKVAAWGLRTADVGKTIAEQQQRFKELDQSFGFHQCGEGGEYETLVLDCPLYTFYSLSLEEWELYIHSDDAFAPVALLQPRRCKLIPKDVSGVFVHRSGRTSKKEEGPMSSCSSSLYIIRSSSSTGRSSCSMHHGTVSGDQDEEEGESFAEAVALAADCSSCSVQDPPPDVYRKRSEKSASEMYILGRMGAVADGKKGENNDRPTVGGDFCGDEKEAAAPPSGTEKVQHHGTPDASSNSSAKKNPVLCGRSSSRIFSGESSSSSSTTTSKKSSCSTFSEGLNSGSSSRKESSRLGTHERPEGTGNGSSSSSGCSGHNRPRANLICCAGTCSESSGCSSSSSSSSSGYHLQSACQQGGAGARLLTARRPRVGYIGCVSPPCCYSPGASTFACTFLRHVRSLNFYFPARVREVISSAAAAYRERLLSFTGTGPSLSGAAAAAHCMRQSISPPCNSPLSARLLRGSAAAAVACEEAAFCSAKEKPFILSVCAGRAAQLFHRVAATETAAAKRREAPTSATYAATECSQDVVACTRTRTPREEGISSLVCLNARRYGNKVLLDIEFPCSAATSARATRTVQISTHVFGGKGKVSCCSDSLHRLQSAVSTALRRLLGGAKAAAVGSIDKSWKCSIGSVVLLSNNDGDVSNSNEKRWCSTTRCSQDSGCCSSRCCRGLKSTGGYNSSTCTFRGSRGDSTQNSNNSCCKSCDSTRSSSSNSSESKANCRSSTVSNRDDGSSSSSGSSLYYDGCVSNADSRCSVSSASSSASSDCCDDHCCQPFSEAVSTCCGEDDSECVFAALDGSPGKDTTYSFALSHAALAALSDAAMQPFAIVSLSIPLPTRRCCARMLINLLDAPPALPTLEQSIHLCIPPPADTPLSASDRQHSALPLCVPVKADFSSNHFTISTTNTVRASVKVTTSASLTCSVTAAGYSTTARNNIATANSRITATPASSTDSHLFSETFCALPSSKTEEVTAASAQQHLRPCCLRQLSWEVSASHYRPEKHLFTRGLNLWLPPIAVLPEPVQQKTIVWPSSCVRAPAAATLALPRMYPCSVAAMQEQRGTATAAAPAAVEAELARRDALGWRRCETGCSYGKETASEEMSSKETSSRQVSASKQGEGKNTLRTSETLVLLAHDLHEVTHTAEDCERYSMERRGHASESTCQTEKSEGLSARNNCVEGADDKWRNFFRFKCCQAVRCRRQRLRYVLTQQLQQHTCMLRKSSVNGSCANNSSPCCGSDCCCAAGCESSCSTRDCKGNSYRNGSGSPRDVGSGVSQKEDAVALSTSWYADTQHARVEKMKPSYRLAAAAGVDAGTSAGALCEKTCRGSFQLFRSDPRLIKEDESSLLLVGGVSGRIPHSNQFPERCFAIAEGGKNVTPIAAAGGGVAAAGLAAVRSPAAATEAGKAEAAKAGVDATGGGKSAASTTGETVAAAASAFANDFALEVAMAARNLQQTMRLCGAASMATACSSETATERKTAESDCDSEHEGDALAESEKKEAPNPAESIDTDEVAGIQSTPLPRPPPLLFAFLRSDALSSLKHWGESGMVREAAAAAAGDLANEVAAHNASHRTADESPQTQVDCSMDTIRGKMKRHFRENELPWVRGTGSAATCSAQRFLKPVRLQLQRHLVPPASGSCVALRNGLEAKLGSSEEERGSRRECSTYRYEVNTRSGDTDWKEGKGIEGGESKHVTGSRGLLGRRNRGEECSRVKKSSGRADDCLPEMLIIPAVVEGCLQGDGKLLLWPLGIRGPAPSQARHPLNGAQVWTDATVSIRILQEAAPFARDKAAAGEEPAMSVGNAATDCGQQHAIRAASTDERNEATPEKSNKSSGLTLGRDTVDEGSGGQIKVGGCGQVDGIRENISYTQWFLRVQEVVALSCETDSSHSCDGRAEDHEEERRADYLAAYQPPNGFNPPLDADGAGDCVDRKKSLGRSSQKSAFDVFFDDVCQQGLERDQADWGAAVTSVVLNTSAALFETRYKSFEAQCEKHKPLARQDKDEASVPFLTETATVDRNAGARRLPRGKSKSSCAEVSCKEETVVAGVESVLERSKRKEKEAGIADPGAAPRKFMNDTKSSRGDIKDGNMLQSSGEKRLLITDSGNKTRSLKTGDEPLLTVLTDYVADQIIRITGRLYNAEKSNVHSLSERRPHEKGTGIVARIEQASEKHRQSGDKMCIDKSDAQLCSHLSRSEVLLLLQSDVVVFVLYAYPHIGEVCNLGRLGEGKRTNAPDEKSSLLDGDILACGGNSSTAILSRADEYLTEESLRGATRTIPEPLTEDYSDVLLRADDEQREKAKGEPRSDVHAVRSSEAVSLMADKEDVSPTGVAHDKEEAEDEANTKSNLLSFRGEAYNGSHFSTVTRGAQITRPCSTACLLEEYRSAENTTIKYAAATWESRFRQYLTSALQRRIPAFREKYLTQSIHAHTLVGKKDFAIGAVGTNEFKTSKDEALAGATSQKSAAILPSTELHTVSSHLRFDVPVFFLPVLALEDDAVVHVVTAAC